MHAMSQKATGPATWDDARVPHWGELRAALAEPIRLPRPVEVHLVRHGQTETNARSLVTGAQDVALTAAGLEQARLAGRHLARRYDVAFHSRLSRSRVTLAEAVTAGGVSVGAVHADRRLDERGPGELELKPSAPVEGFSRGDLSYAPPGGDSYALVARRALGFLADLARLVAGGGASAVLVCSHMGPMRILLGVFEERADAREVLARSFGNTDVIRVTWHRLAMAPFLDGAAAAG